MSDTTSKKTVRITIPVAVRAFYLANPVFTGPLHEAFEAHRDKPEMRIHVSDVELHRLNSLILNYHGDEAKLKKGFTTLRNTIEKALESLGATPLSEMVDYIVSDVPALTTVQHGPRAEKMIVEALGPRRGNSTTRLRYRPNAPEEKARQHGLATALNKREKTIGPRGSLNRSILVNHNDGDHNVMFHATKGPRRVRINPFIQKPSILVPSLDFNALVVEHALAA